MKTITPSAALPAARITRLLAPIRRFIAIEAASGVLLLFAAAVALVLANSPYAESFSEFWHTHLRIGIGRWEIDESLLHWVNDGLMTIFFFVVGLEIKREIVAGELNNFRKAALPLMAALGGMVAPAAIYLLLIGDQAEGKQGWGIPMATDIAFVVGFLALLGNRVPSSLKILLLALAIVDDIGAIVVIALFYSDGISLPALSLAAVGTGVTVLCHWLGVRSFGVYTLIGAAIWLAMFHSGIHPTVAGVILGLLTPATPIVARRALWETFASAVASDDDKAVIDLHGQLASVATLKSVASETISPLERLEFALHPWVAFVVMPLFALANAGVPIELGAVTHPVAWSVALGLIIGKPLGIAFFSWLAVKIGLATLPIGVTWKVIVGAGMLAGIGFTMSLFIASLALEGDLLSAGKIGTLVGSAISAIAGVTTLSLLLKSSDNRSLASELEI
jgi:Na+:H+ antiporter, NhaA family